MPVQSITAGADMNGGEELVAMSYQASLRVLKNVVPFAETEDDTAATLARLVKSVPRNLAAGLAPHATASQGECSLSEAMRCCRELCVMLAYCRDLSGQFINGGFVAQLIETYRGIEEETGRHLVKAQEAAS